ncbi:hypothetical protein LIER_08166 [Lithospermum erythrorhizon]|uniref:Uncharacterized protein n=1 Tax=Lithospermum erythrorhizon TaxID=34254 RepID=A0AAV3PC12_LITER
MKDLGEARKILGIEIVRDRNEKKFRRGSDERVVLVEEVYIGTWSQTRKIELEKIHTDDNGLDMLTKFLSRGKFGFCRTVAGLVLPFN